MYDNNTGSTSRSLNCKGIVNSARRLVVNDEIAAWILVRYISRKCLPVFALKSDVFYGVFLLSVANVCFYQEAKSWSSELYGR